jgi:hypothetical protein
MSDAFHPAPRSIDGKDRRWLCPFCGGTGQNPSEAARAIAELVRCPVCEGFDPDVLAAFSGSARMERLADEVVALWGRLVEEQETHAVFSRMRTHLDTFARSVEWAIDPERRPLWERRERPALPPLAEVKEALRALHTVYQPAGQTPPMEVLREHFNRVAPRTRTACECSAIDGSGLIVHGMLCDQSGPKTDKP